MVKLAESHPKKLSYTSLPENASLSIHTSLKYGVYQSTKAELHSIDFAVTRLLMKLFKTSNIAVIKYCCRSFGFQLRRELLGKRFTKFMSKRNTSRYTSFWPRGYCVTCTQFISTASYFCFAFCFTCFTCFYAHTTIIETMQHVRGCQARCCSMNLNVNFRIIVVYFLIVFLLTF